MVSAQPDRVVLAPGAGNFGVDVVVYDVLRLADDDTDELRRLVDASKGVVALAHDLRPDLTRRARCVGVAAVLSVSVTVDELLGVIARIAAGEPLDEVEYASGDWLGRQEGLTPRESEVIAMIGEGLNNEEIAARLFLSINSIKTYVRTGYRKIGAHSRAQAVRWAVEQRSPILAAYEHPAAPGAQATSLDGSARTTAAQG